MTEEEIAKLAHLRDVLAAAPIPDPVPTSLGLHRALRTGDNRKWTPVECLQDTINDIVTGKTPCDKLFVVRLNTKGGEEFNVGYNAANIRASEILAALECAKAQVLQEMGYTE